MYIKIHIKKYTFNMRERERENLKLRSEKYKWHPNISMVTKLIRSCRIQEYFCNTAPGVWITEMLYNQIIVVRCSPHNPALITSLQMENCSLQIALTILRAVCYLVCIISLVVQVLNLCNIKCMQKTALMVGAISEPLHQCCVWTFL